MQELMPDETIRLAGKTDLPVIDDIYNQAVSSGLHTAHLTPLPRAERQNWFNSHEAGHYPIFVYTKNRRILGWASLSPYRPGRAALNDVAELSLYIDFQHHGEGIGSKLVGHCLEKAPLLKKRILFSIIIEGNHASINLMQKFGFEQWGYLPQVIKYRDLKRGHIYMGKILDDNRD